MFFTCSIHKTSAVDSRFRFGLFRSSSVFLGGENTFSPICGVFLGCVSPHPSFTYSMSRMSKCPECRHRQERFRETFICEYCEKRGSFISLYKLHWADKNPPPEKSFHPKCRRLLSKVAAFRCCHSLASVMYRGRAVSMKRGLHLSTATCLRLAVDIQLFSKAKQSLF